MIPKNKYINYSTCGVCVTMELVKGHHTEEEVSKFCKFMFGQTGVILPDGQYGIYAHDYERWLKQGRKNHQMAHDWD